MYLRCTFQQGTVRAHECPLLTVHDVPLALLVVCSPSALQRVATFPASPPQSRRQTLNNIHPNPSVEDVAGATMR